MDLQISLRERLRLVSELDPRRVRYVAGADLSCPGPARFAPRSPGGCRVAGGAPSGRRTPRPEMGYAAVVVVDLCTWETIEVGRAEGPLTFPYVPGLLAFRELPLLESAFRQLTRRPQALLCDGQGYAHPRRMGLASMAGLLLGIPSAGCAKTRLCGQEKAPGRPRGRYTWLVHEGERVGMTLRTREGVRPIYVSPGHGLDFFAARALALRCTPRYRIPEPIRRAHAEVNALRRAGET